MLDTLVHNPDAPTEAWPGLEGLPDEPRQLEDGEVWPDPPALAPPAEPWPPPLPPAPPLPAGRNRRSRRGMGWALLMAAAVLVGLFGGMTYRITSAPTSQSTAAPPTTRAPRPSVPSTTPPSSTPPSSVPRNSSPPSSTPRNGTPPSSTPPSTAPGTATTADWDAIADKVNPGVVDIVSRMPGGVGAGTGMVLTENGEILTNNHVIDGADRIVVTLVTTGARYDATVVGTDPSEDVAVLQLSDASGLSPIAIGNSDEVEAGDEVAAIGNAGGQGGLPDVAPGHVIALHQRITASNPDGSNQQTLSDTIRVDANVQEGDSGGPLVDTDGKVIGVDSAASVSGGRRQRTASHEGYAIPINKAIQIAKQLETNGSKGQPSSPNQQASNRAFLGVQTQTATTSSGAEIVSVQPGSPAANAGLKAGDTIVTIDGTDVESADDLVAALQQHQAGDQVEIGWITNAGVTKQQSVTLASR